MAARAARVAASAGTSLAARDVRLGKDVLELLSTAMYVDPLVVYREYVQNAADSIDAARRAGRLAPDGGRVEVAVNAQSRSVRIRDDGLAPDSADFVSRMVALGGSEKRGTPARGFRGVGRLAGLGHAQELIFRSRAEGEAEVSEVRWDGRALKSALADPDFQGDVAELVSQVVTVVRRAACSDDPPRFFEVELLRVPRGRSDKLLSAEEVVDYLSQVAPVPFNPDFNFGHQITEQLRAYPGFSEVAVTINDGAPLTRPHRNTVDFGGRVSQFEPPVFVEVPSQDGSRIAAVAWFLHHGYEGALSVSTLVKGLRLRGGNMQIGDGAILESLFSEARFNSWSVGEVHVLDPRLSPNGRRDQFEYNVHYGNLLTHLLPVTRDITQRCRTYSSRRSKLREFELVSVGVRERLDVLEQGGLDEAARSQAAAAAEAGVRKLELLAASPLLAEAKFALDEQIAALRGEIEGVSRAIAAGDPLVHLPKPEQEFFRRMISMIYAHSNNRSAAKALVERILQRELTQGANAS
ncbi:hypothetical protein TSO221_28945 [Azospirillum sp. TSO22-1]|nr:hypothetical protein TSO221_28945 [Azospirillum sp. TSO22-1]